MLNPNTLTSRQVEGILTDWEPHGDEPWSPATVRGAVRRIIASDGGEVVLTRHARDRFQDRDMSMDDLLNVLASGWCDGTRTSVDPVKGTSYRYNTNEMWVQIALDWPDAIVIVSCGRQA